MNNIFYKLFYLIYINVLKNPNNEDENEFPFASIIIITFLLGLNIMVFVIFCNELFFNFNLSKKLLFVYFGLPSVIFSLLFGVNKNYQKLYNVFKKQEIEKREIHNVILITYIVLTIISPMVLGLLLEFNII